MILKIKRGFGKKGFFLLIGFLLILFFVFLYFLYFLNIKPSVSFLCGDGTKYNECSKNKPYFCDKGILIEKASLCGCPELFYAESDLCFSDYENSSISNLFYYSFKENSFNIEYETYDDVVSYLREIPVFKTQDGFLSQQDYKLRKIDDPLQREYLIAFLVKIQNIEKNKINQLRILLSLVQNIPYGSSLRNISIGGFDFPYSRFPYEVLYENYGVCGEKAELLAFFLREMGYGVVLFYFPDNNHEVVGIKCPLKYSYDSTGYCFVEQTGPSILSSSDIIYSDGKLSNNYVIIEITEGDSLPLFMEEYSDAEFWSKIYSKILQGRYLTGYESKKYKEIKDKYGLNKNYSF